MGLFTSNKERKLWLYAGICWLGILSVLFLGNPLLTLLANQGVQAGLFLWGMFVVLLIILVHAFGKKSQRLDIILWLAIIAVFSMFLLRLGLPERSHLIEYSVLGVLIHAAFLERRDDYKGFWKASFQAAALTTLLGTIDELFQLFIPERVFDFNDILFNSFTALLAVGSRVLVHYIKQWISRRKTTE